VIRLETASPKASHLARRHWQAVCECGSEDVYEEPADRRARLDPLDPSTFVHAPQCENRDVTDPAVLRAILRVHDREGYWWVECAACDCGWQVPHYADAKNVG
jgi:hypothetical protein